jgi:hypothetical protein
LYMNGFGLGGPPAAQATPSFVSKPGRSSASDFSDIYFRKIKVCVIVVPMSAIEMGNARQTDNDRTGTPPDLAPVECGRRRGYFARSALVNGGGGALKTIPAAGGA